MFARARLPLLLATGCAGAFLVLLAVAYGVGFARWADAAALQGFLSLRDPFTMPILERLAQLADPVPYALFGLALMAAALAQGRVRHAAAAGLLLGGSAVSSQVLKPLLATPRPVDFAEVQAAAYPSGHATAAMALALAAVLVAPPAWRRAVAVAGGAFVLAVSFSILALGWHFPSDVVGGYLVAGVWCLASIGALRATAGRRRGRRTGQPLLSEVEPRTVRAVAGAAGIATAVVLGALAPQAAGYAQRHTTAAVVAMAITAAAAGVLAAATAATRR